MDMLTGEFKAVLDEKGRISLPAQLRRVLNEAKLTITQCKDKCLHLFPKDAYMEKLKAVSENTIFISKEDREVKRRLFNCLDLEIDKAGRIPIAQTYRDFAGLTKECVFLGQGDYIEIWDSERYEQYLAESEDDYDAASGRLAEKMKNGGSNL